MELLKRIKSKGIQIPIVLVTILLCGVLCYKKIIITKRESKGKLGIFGKLFYKRCLFCEVVIEGIGIRKTDNPTILPLCDFCLKRWEVIEELKKDEKANKDQIMEVRNCFKNSCYFCNEKAIKRISVMEVAEKVVNKVILGYIGTCEACYTRYNALTELEQQKPQQLGCQIQIQ